MPDVRLLLGDCVEVMRGMADRSVDAIVTDPPYGTEELGGGYGRKKTVEERPSLTIANDKDLAILKEAVPEWVRILKPSAWLAVFCATKRRREVEDILDRHGFGFFGEVIWDKGVPGLGYHIRYSHETVLIFRRGLPPRPAAPILSVIRETIPSGKRAGGHPHEKPVPLLAELVRWCTPEDGVVLDSFVGSGSTLVACMKTGRNGIGIELDAKYIPVIERRLQRAGTPLFEPIESKAEYLAIAERRLAAEQARTPLFATA
jgi:DNA modification methylase